MRTVGVWVAAVALVVSVAFQVEERQDRKALLGEQRYQSCMAQEIGSATDLLLLESSGADEAVSGTRAVQLDEAMSRCRKAFPHTTTPTTVR